MKSLYVLEVDESILAVCSDEKGDTVHSFLLVQSQNCADDDQSPWYGRLSGTRKMFA